MSQSTDGQICYGIPFEEDFPFPWENEEEWWRKINGFTQVEIYDKADPSGSGYKGGKPNESVINNYFDEKTAWDKVHPLPIKLVNYCSGDCPMYIITLEETFKNSSRGHPEEFNPSDLKVTDEQRQKLIDFCNKYLGEAIKKYNEDLYSLIYEYTERKIVLDPKWYLTSYWG